MGHLIYSIIPTTSTTTTTTLMPESNELISQTLHAKDLQRNEKFTKICHNHYRRAYSIKQERFERYAFGLVLIYPEVE